MNTTIDTNNLYLLGAGFDKAINDKSPLNTELMNLLKLSDKFTQWSSRYEYAKGNIELLLTYLDLDIKNQPQLSEYREEIEKSLVILFRKYRFTKENSKPWMKTFAEELLQKNDAIVNLNYSCACEGLLDYYKVWSPIGEGYSRFLSNYAAETRDSASDNNSNVVIKNIKIYKLHGSENFDEIYDLSNNNQTYIEPLIDKTLFPNSSAYSWFGTGIGKKKTTGHIIAPSYMKFPHVQVLYMMDEVLYRARLAQKLIIMGCGLREEDQFLWLLVCTFLNQDKPLKENIKRILIIDPNAENLQDRMQKYFTNMEGFFKQNGRVVLFKRKIEDEEQMKNLTLELNKKPI